VGVTACYGHYKVSATDHRSQPLSLQVLFWSTWLNLGALWAGNVVAFYCPIKICMEIWNSTFLRSEQVKVGEL